MHGLAGLVVLALLAWLIGGARRAVPWRVVIGGFVLQAALAALFLKLPAAVTVLVYADRAVGALQSATDAGTTLVFGFLGGGPLPYAETHPGASFILAFRALPMVLVVSALVSLLTHWGILQRIVGALAWLLARTLGIGGALGLGAATHIFVGMIEAPLLVRSYLAGMSRGELHALMSCGLAGIAGTVMAIYGAIVAPAVPGSFSQILVAAVLSTPAALALAALMVPFVPDDDAHAKLEEADRDGGAIAAIVRGTMDGVGLLAAIIATLIVLVALVTLANLAVGLVAVGGAPLSLQRILAWGFRPLVWLIGVPWDQSAAAATLMGTKTVLNEFVAYLDLAHLPEDALDPRSRLMMVYALCGFANFGSLGILLGGLGQLLPERRAEVAALGWRALITGTLATLTSGAVVGLLTP